MATDKFTLVGIYGGTFDPIHYGHLRIAEELFDIIGLERIIFIPSGDPRLRTAPAAPRNHRSAMVHLAIHNNHRFLLDEREINRPGISKTVDSLREYRCELGKNTAFCFILGMDAFLKINHWHSWHDLFKLCHIIVVDRPGYTLFNNHPGLHVDIKDELISRQVLNVNSLRLQFNGFIYTAQTSLLEISASKIRSLIADGRSIRYLLPDSVFDYIKSNNLYTGRI